jgi:hypothetical protein
MQQNDENTSITFFQILSGILREPGYFFSRLPDNIKIKQPIGFLMVSGLIFTACSLMITNPESPVLFGGIIFLNAIGMAFIAAGFGYIIMIMLIGRQVAFKKFFSVFALSTGVTLLASWLPISAWIIEPWKWWLIGTGMTKGFGFSKRHAILIICLTISIIILFFQSALPLLTLSRRYIS